MQTEHAQQILADRLVVLDARLAALDKAVGGASLAPFGMEEGRMGG